MEQSFRLKKGEEFLILFDPCNPKGMGWKGESDVAEALFLAANDLGAIPQIIMLSCWPRDTEPPKATTLAMKSVNALCGLSMITYTKAIDEAQDAGVRFLNLCGIKKR